ncbi:MAG TPA: alpha/beta hydrolase, partial [Luteolibacter sp.]
MNDAHESLDFLRNLPPASEPRFWEIAPGQRLAWDEYGDPNGFPVMYYHGWPSSRSQARIAHHLAWERGLRLVAMDRPGMGRSTFEAGRTLESWPELMERFADALGIGKFGQLGISGGGPYVLACAARIPGRLSGSAVLSGAVLLDGLASGLRGLHPAYRMLIPIRKLPSTLFSPMFRLAAAATHWNPARPPLSWVLQTLAAEDRKLLLDHPQLFDVLNEGFRQAAIVSGGRGVMMDAAIYFQRLEIDPQNVRHPIRYWHGGDDRNIPLSMVREFTGKIAGAELIV